MELVLLCLSLLVHHGLTQEACRCLDPSLCGAPAGCGYKCQAGFAGFNCREVNHGFNLSPDAPDIFDGDLSTCREYKGRINFSHPIDIDKIRILRPDKDTGIFFAYVYASTRVPTWLLRQYKRSIEGGAAVASFPLQTGVTAIKIDNMRTACEVELSDGTVGPKQPEKTTPRSTPTPNTRPRPRPRPTPTPRSTPTPTPTPTPSKALTCPQNHCNGRGTCQIEGNSQVCRCNDGYKGERCKSKCKIGRYGSECIQECAKNCKKGTCDHVDGSCECNPGWTGAQCTDRCPSNTYGGNCSSTCSVGCKNDKCRRVDGKCIHGCKNGWTHSTNKQLCDKKCSKGRYGSQCGKYCPRNCKDGECNHVDGSCVCKPGWRLRHCLQRCAAGTYGLNCSSSCSSGCRHKLCKSETGECTYESCEDGWIHSDNKQRCDAKQCSTGCASECNRNGRCQRCKPGWSHRDTSNPRCDRDCSGHYGSGCQQPCSSGCSGNTCDHVTGVCTCKDGWTGEKCDECADGHYGDDCGRCSDRCENTCDKQSGVCNCRAGWTGPSCSKEIATTPKQATPAPVCPQNYCNGQGTCRIQGNKLVCACNPGRRGIHCGNVCENGTFGAGCGVKCSPYCYNTTCHHVHGACLNGCLDGWTGENCQEQIGRESTAQSSFPYAVIGLVLLLLSLLIVLIVVYRRRKKNPRPVVKARRSLDIEVPLALREPVVGVDDADEVENEYANKPDPVSSTSVPLSGLKAYVASKKEIKETLLNEYTKLPQGLIAAHDISLTAENNPKNRFRGVYPYNHTLVPLNNAQGRPTYINANFIDGLAMKNMYIATQGPLPDTVADLWEMIWQYNIPVIVMLANILEDGKRRCEPYWPMETDPTVQTFGHISVSVADETHYSDFTVRTLRFSKGRHSRTLKHVHYTVWPDKGVPADTLSLVSLRQKVRSLCDFDLGPLLVHCSAGIGRTGTLIALDYLMEQADSQNRVDIFGTVWTLRGYRVKMVQTDVQYVFLHDCILDAVEYTQTPTPVKLFVDVCKRLNRESGSEQSPNLALNFKRLQETPVPVNTTRAAKDHNNLDKNRSKDILPGDLHRPYLMKPVAGRTDYINAVMASSYRRRNALILTQSPLKSTVVDFWRLIRDHSIERVVLLDNYTESDEDCGVFWPEGEQRCHFGPITISKSKFEQHNGFSMETLEYQESSPDASENKTTVESVTLFRCTFWAQNQSLPESDSRMLCFLDFIRQWDSVTSPLVVVCRDGCTRSGLYCVLSNVLERLISEQEVAINNAIRRLRLVRGQAVSSMEQYKFLHDAVSTYILNFHDYSNV